MNKKHAILILVLLTLNLFSFSQSAYKVIKLYNNEITLTVPTDWKIKEKAMRFADYEIKYDVAVKNPKNQTGISLYVFDSLYGPKMQISDSIVRTRKDALLSDPVRKVQFEGFGIRMVSGIKVGYLKYTFNVSNKFKRAYGIDMFFCDKRNIYYKIEVIGLNTSVKEFRPVAEKVFESLAIQ